MGVRDDAAGAWAQADHAALARTEGSQRAEAEGEARQRLAELLGIVFRLRDADGCAWDREQTLASMARHLVEEACETADAIAAGDDAHVCEELGDTLMNVFLMARIAEQERRFDLAAVAAGIAEKLVRRHPHVFGSVSAADADAALASWDASKAREAPTTVPRSAVDGVSASLPALLLALKTGEKVARTGFDWPDARGALDKVAEELAELEEALAGEAREAGGPAGAGPPRAAGASSSDAVERELGDLLLATVAVARKLGRDPERALRRATRRFAGRFRALEAELGDELRRRPLPELLAAWRALPRDDDAGG